MRMLSFWQFYAILMVILQPFWVVLVAIVV